MTVTVGSTVTTMQFYYNASGVPVVFKYNGTLYYYLTNLQGDVKGKFKFSMLGSGILPGLEVDFDLKG